MTDSNKINGKSRRTLISILIVVFALTLVGGTLAYLIFGMDILNGNYISKTKCFNFSYSNTFNNQQITGELMPSNKDKGGISGTVSIASSCNVEAKGNLLFKVNASSAVLASQVAPHCENANTLETLNYNETDCKNADNAVWVTNGSALKYSVYDNTTGEHFASGYANTTGEAIKMYKNFIIPSDGSVVDFNVYIWLDTNLIDDSYANVSLSGYVYADATQRFPGQPNEPVLDPGMIPVTIADDGTVTIVSEDDPNWYDYSNKKWANVVLVNTNATANVEGSQPRSYYLSNLSNNVEVNQSDILAYYVWIPRYKYKMPQTKCSDIENPTMADNPECYAPYTLTDDEKNALIKYRSDNALCEEMYGEEQINAESTKDIELGLSTGRLSSGTSIISYVEEYNNSYLENEGNTPCMWEGLDVSEITLTSSDFNGNITYTTKEGTIDISFESSSESMSLGNAKTEYRTHPAFWWNHDNDTVVDTGETVPGIWVGKFETTPDKSSTCYITANSSNCNNATQNATILPNTISLRYQTVSNQFATSQNFSKSGNIYGLSNSNTNAHMMKNSEWGAVAYLSHSVYGINGEIYINNNSKFYTGRSGGSTSASSETYGTYTWLGQTLDTSGNIGAYAADRTYGTNASTTGNVTGIYDMSGGAWEYVMGHYGDTVYIDEVTFVGDYSGFEELPESKYYDLYSEEDFPGTYNGNLAYCTIDSCGGHALNETAGWYNDYAAFVVWVGPWFVRGGNYGNGRNAGAFGFHSFDGSELSHHSWRSVVVPGFGA